MVSHNLLSIFFKLITYNYELAWTIHVGDLLINSNTTWHISRRVRETLAIFSQIRLMQHCTISQFNFGPDMVREVFFLKFYINNSVSIRPAEFQVQIFFSQTSQIFGCMCDQNICTLKSCI